MVKAISEFQSFAGLNITGKTGTRSPSSAIIWTRDGERIYIYIQYVHTRLTISDKTYEVDFSPLPLDVSFEEELVSSWGQQEREDVGRFTTTLISISNDYSAREEHNLSLQSRG